MFLAVILSLSALGVAMLTVAMRRHRRLTAQNTRLMVLFGICFLTLVGTIAGIIIWRIVVAFRDVWHVGG